MSTIDPTIFSDASDGDVLEAKDIRDRAEELQRFLNGRIQPSDISDTAFVDTQHIVKPEFYGAPSPRIEGVSSDTYYRKRSGNILDSYYRHEGSGSGLMTTFSSPDTSDINLWQPIEGMSATIHCHEHNAYAACIGSFRAYEDGGTIQDFIHDFKESHPGLVDEISALEAFSTAEVTGEYIAEFMLFVDTGSGPVAYPRTRRRVFGSGEDIYKCRRTNHSFIQDMNLSQGENKISYRCFYRLPAITDRRMIHLYVRARNFVVDVHYR